MFMRVRQGHTDCPLALAKVAQQESILLIRKLIRKLPHACHAQDNKYQVLEPLLAMTPQLGSHQLIQPKSRTFVGASALA
jgi:hypothetical protein